MTNDLASPATHDAPEIGVRLTTLDPAAGYVRRWCTSMV